MEKELKTIPFVAHEAAMFRKERIIKRLIAALVLSNIIAIIAILIKKGE